jgi:UDP-N-acetylmuramoylalanine--D-glutamate ligase
MKHYKTALVLGLGTSGFAAARLLSHEGTTVTAVDGRRNKDLINSATKLKKLGVQVILDSRRLPRRNATRDFEICIISPGIPPDSNWIKDLECRNVEIISELELGASRCKCPILAVTGSKGKSTLVKLCFDAMKLAGKRAAIAGNYGIPLCEVAAASRKLDWVVLEVSSFQLERVRSFRPRVGVLLNVQPDHLDRHGDMKTYLELKSRIFTRMRETDAAIIFDRNLKAVRHAARGRQHWITFGLSQKADFRYAEKRVRFKEHNKRASISLEGSVFANDILGISAAAAVAAIRACHVPSAAVEKAVQTFLPLPHRMSEIAVIAGVRFVNDSKATSITALCAGVKMCAGPVRLIAGGLLKEKALTLAKKVLERRVKSIYLIGKASQEMNKAWGSVVRCCLCGDLKTAILRAFRDAKTGETVLLSPGCASFDQFRNFEDRGNQFVKIVRSINEER